MLAAPEGVGIRLGIEQAIRAFLDAVERGGRPAGETDELWRRLGEAEFQAGRSLDDLRAAFRTGTRAAWRGAADLARRAGVSAPIAIALAEAIFIYCDELATDVVEGYLRMQSDEAGERERRRRRLARLLLDPDGHDPEACSTPPSSRAGRCPDAGGAGARGREPAGAVRRRLDVDVLRRRRRRRRLAGRSPTPTAPVAATRSSGRSTARPPRSVPTVAPARAHRSLRWARLTLELARRARSRRARRRGPPIIWRR